MPNMCLKPAIRGMMKKNSFNTQFFDKLCSELNIYHKTIRPRTPWHNGKVERSHRNDQRYFYDWETFRNVDELNEKLEKHLEWSNNKPMRTLTKVPNSYQRRSQQHKMPFFALLFRSATLHSEGEQKTLYQSLILFFT